MCGQMVDGLMIFEAKSDFDAHFAIFTRHLGFGHFVQLGFGHPFSTGFGHSIRSLHRLDSPAIFCPYRKRAWFAHSFLSGDSYQLPAPIWGSYKK
jgi:hypothetical protein